MAIDPLGLAVKTRIIGETENVRPSSEKSGGARSICIRADADVSDAETVAAVNEVFKAVRARKRRARWNFVE